MCSDRPLRLSRGRTLGARRDSSACDRVLLASDIVGIGTAMYSSKNALQCTFSFRPSNLYRVLSLVVPRTRFGLQIENSPDDPTVVGSAGVFSCPARDATANTVCFDAVSMRPPPAVLLAAAAAAAAAAFAATAYFASQTHGA